MANKTNQNTRILNYLMTGRTLTKATARNRFGVQKLSARVSELRKDGYPIYCNSRKAKDGSTKYSYRLGTPTRRVVAAGYLATSDSL